jgi:uncharacterized protein (DUF433 family)
MNKQQLLQRIVVNRDVMVGKPIIRGTRLTVQYVLGRLALEESIDEILQEYDGLAREDILACLLFASEALDSTTFAPLTAKAD